jgi:hypothetical protein
MERCIDRPREARSAAIIASGKAHRSVQLLRTGTALGNRQLGLISERRSLSKLSD